jgi:histidyl-tRNA synthetase
LRVLDCKEQKCQEIVQSAPQIIDHLCKECHDHFKEVLEFLDELELPYHLDPYLARGLDYYTKTVFEIFSENETALSQTSSEKKDENLFLDFSPKRNALAGGGRYDKLVKLLGGKDTPACGGAAGIERIIELIKSKKKELFKISKPKIFLAQLGKKAKRKSLKLVEEFRKAKVPIAVALSKDSLKSQLKLADKLGVKYTLILGEKEVIEEEILIRDMKTGKQRAIKIGKIVREIKKRI